MRQFALEGFVLHLLSLGARCSLVFVVALAACAEEQSRSSDVATVKSGLAGACSLEVTSSAPPINGTSANDAFDRDPTTVLETGNNTWQSIQVDFGCAVVVTGFRRAMTGAGGDRGLQGERLATSVDGINWTYLTNSTSSGWWNYTYYAPEHWHSVDYGWSTWLRPSTPLEVRYVKFVWDGNNDTLDEIEIDSRQLVSSEPPLLGSLVWDAIDGDVTTQLDTGYNQWQQLVVDFGEPVQVRRVRRHMTGIGADRGLQGERFKYSDDGTNWTAVETSETTGWEAYVDYASTAWHTVDYGWSEWLEFDSPIVAQYWMFDWDGNNDALSELEFDRWVDGGDPAYDFSLSDPTFQSSYGSHASQYIGLGSGTYADFVSMRVPHDIGLTGTYDGNLYGWGSHGQTSITVVLRDDGSEVRGMLQIQNDGLVSYYGGLCGEQPLPIGAEIDVRMTPWSSYDGRFSAWDATYDPGYPFYDTRDFVEGSTTRYVDNFFVSGDVVFEFHAMLQVDDLFGSWLVGDLKINAPSPCDDATMTITAKRRDLSLAQGLGYSP